MTDKERWNPTPPGWSETPKLAPKAGESVWSLSRDGRTIACELRDESRSGAGWDVVIRQDGELSFSRRCADEAGARYVADALRQDHINAGWTEKGDA